MEFQKNGGDAMRDTNKDIIIHRFCSIILPAQPARQSSLISFRNIELSLTDLAEKTVEIQVKEISADIEI